MLTLVGKGDSESLLKKMHCKHIHRFDLKLKVTLKDAFNDWLFGEIDTMLTKLYYLYQRSPKRYHELNKLSEVYDGEW